MHGFLSLFGRKPGVVWHDNKLGETLGMFKQEKSHMAIVRDVESVGEVIFCFSAASLTKIFCSILFFLTY